MSEPDAEIEAAKAEAVARVEARRLKAKLAESWTKCCRCFPNSVGLDGFCSCCGWDNETKKTREGWGWDPDHFAPPQQTDGGGE